MGLSTNLFWSCQIWGQIFFRTFSFTKHSGLWICGEGWGCVWSSTFFGHAKFEVKNFLELGPYTNFLWSYQIWRQTFFCLQSALDSEFFLEAGVPSTNFFGSSQIWNQTFFGCQIWGQKFFLEFFRLQKSLGSEVFGGGSKEIFFVYRVLWTLNLSGGSGCPGINLGTNFFVHAKYEIKFFF